jgi:putative FmdB family regulatory protein
MPIYEYRCQECNTTFEVLALSSREGTAVRCSSCGGSKVTKLISAGSLRVADGAPRSLPSAPACGAKSGFS